jgi:hypothetical protein
MNSGLERKLDIFTIEVQTGTRDVALDGENITGAWVDKGAIHRIGEQPREIALHVLNPFLSGVRLTDAVLDFTKRYGPLTVPFRSAEPFRFSIKEWKMARHFLHVLWKAASNGLKRKWPISIPVDKSDGDHFSFDDGRLTFRTQSLSTFMALEIARTPVEKFRQCANFGYGCKAPYFFANDLRERYCSEACARESKKRAKLDWWNNNRKGTKHVAKKTR